MTASSESLKQEAREAIQSAANELESLVADIGAHAELGYHETRTASKMATFFRRLGLPVEDGLAVTGVKAVVRLGSGGPSAALLGELDGLPIQSHPDYSPDSGAVHACGHHAQLGMLAAAAVGLTKLKADHGLAGRVVLIACPAEESVEVDRRLQMRADGLIEFLGGKQELIKQGAFDDVDLAMLIHASSRAETRAIGIGATTNGHLIKRARFLGRSSHAGVAPHDGINALKGATLALAAIDSQRDTFRDVDAVRVHPILTHGGDVVNAVPALAVMEMYVRAKSLEAMRDANLKVDRALRGAAIATGSRVEISTVPGYLPLLQDGPLTSVFMANAVAAVGDKMIGTEGHSGATTDMGDVSHLVPAIQPNCGGFSGTAHGDDFKLRDFEAAVLTPARVLVGTLVDLLQNDASLLRDIRAQSKPLLTKEGYLSAVRELAYESNHGPD